MALAVADATFAVLAPLPLLPPARPVRGDDGADLDPDPDPDPDPDAAFALGFFDPRRAMVPDAGTAGNSKPAATRMRFTALPCSLSKRANAAARAGWSAPAVTAVMAVAMPHSHASRTLSVLSVHPCSNTRASGSTTASGWIWWPWAGTPDRADRAAAFSHRSQHRTSTSAALVRSSALLPGALGCIAAAKSSSNSDSGKQWVSMVSKHDPTAATTAALRSFSRCTSLRAMTLAAGWKRSRSRNAMDCSTSMALMDTAWLTSARYSLTAEMVSAQSRSSPATLTWGLRIFSTAASALARTSHFCSLAFASSLTASMAGNTR